MVIKSMQTKKSLAAAKNAAAGHHPAVDKLIERLSSPRLKASGTISSYVITSNNFLTGIKGAAAPDESDFRQYFIRRRRQGVSENTIRKEFFHLKKLAQANGWVFPFEKDDTPYPDEEAQSHPLQPDLIKHIISIKNKLSNAERFYLAVATTWIVRREDLSRIQTRDFNETHFTIRHSKRGRTVKHLIPDVLKPIFAAYRPKEHDCSALSQMFKRILKKAGVPHQKGWGWHGIRHTLNTLIEAALPANQFDPALIADYAGWSKKSMGRFFGGVSMVGIYRHPEILDTDPDGLDKTIYGVHPFLPLWDKKH